MVEMRSLTACTGRQHPGYDSGLGNGKSVTAVVKAKVKVVKRISLAVLSFCCQDIA
jgi:hypothetical protein